MEFKLSVPKLEDIVLSKITVLLWNNKVIREMIVSLRRKWDIESDIEWVDFSYEVLKRARTLPLSGELTKRLFGVIRPIGTQIKRNHHIYKEWPQHLRWTPHGTVDDAATALTRVKDRRISIETRFHIASENCLEPQIRKLWTEMKRLEFLEAYERGMGAFSWGLFWAYEIRGELRKLRGLKNKYFENDSVYEFAFQNVCVDGNVEAARFYFNALTPEQKLRNLTSFLPIVRDTNVFFFILTEMGKLSPEYQMEVITNDPRRVLVRLLEWPWQDHFLPIVELVMDKLDVDDLLFIVRAIYRGVQIPECDYLVQKRLRSFWLLLPSELRKTLLLMDDALLVDILEKFALKEDARNLKLFLLDTSLSKKEQIIFSYQGLDLCLTLFYLAGYSGNYSLAEFFVRECVQNRGKAIFLKSEMERLWYTFEKLKCYEHSGLEVAMRKISEYLNRIYSGASCREIEYKKSPKDSSSVCS